MSDLTDLLFPQKTTPDAWRQRLDLDGLETQHGLPSGVLTQVLTRESAGDPTAQSRAGAQGLFQLMPGTAAQYKANPHEPQEAARAAAQELGTLYKKYDGDLPSTLAAWNWGQGNLDKQGIAKAPQETRGFVSSVLRGLGPRSAEAAPRQQAKAPSPPAEPQDLTDLLFGAASQAPPTPLPAPAASPEAPPQPGRPHLVIDIAKPSTGYADEVQAIEPLVPVDKARLMQGAFSPTEGMAEGPELSQLPADVSGPGYTGAAKLLGSMALSGGGAALGALGGGIPGAMYGGAVGYGLSTLAGLEPPSWLGAAVNTLAPGLPAIPRLAKGAIAATRASRALTKAEQETAEQATQYLEQYQTAAAKAQEGRASQVSQAAQRATQQTEQQVARATEQYQTAAQTGMEQTQTRQANYDLDLARFETQEARREAGLVARQQRAQAVAAQQTQAREAAALEQHQVAQAAGQETAAARQANYDLDLQRFQTQETQRLAGHARRVQQAQEVAEAKNQAAQAAYAQESRDAYQAAVQEARQAQSTYRQELADYKTAEQAHTAAVERLQALPARYTPQMPARTAQDVRRDLARLEEGGAAEADVLQRLGAEDIFEASTALRAEEAALGRAPGPGQPLATSFRQSTPAPSEAIPELQALIRQRTPGGRWGIKLEGETDIPGELQGQITRAAVGRQASLLNNKTGFTLQEMADRAAEQGFIETPDKIALVNALRRSVTEGQPVYGRGTGSPEPVSPPAAPAPRPQGGRGQRASQVLYDRFDDVAGSTPVDLTPAIDMGRVMREQLELSAPSMRTARLRKVLEDMETMGSQGTASQTYQLMKDIGPLTRSNDGKMRGTARQLYNALHDSMAQSAPLEVRQILDQAKTTWRQEHAVGELQELIGRRGAAILKQDPQGRLTLNVATLLNKTDDLISKEGSFFNAFAPQELEALQADLRGFIGTPARPTRAPVQPVPVRVRDVGPEPSLALPRDVPPLPPRLEPKSLVGGRPTDYVPETFTPPEPVAPRVVPPLSERLPPKSVVQGRPPDYTPEPFRLPPAVTPNAVPLAQPQPFALPPPVEPTIRAPLFLRDIRVGGTLGYLLGAGGVGRTVAATAVTLDTMEWVISQALLHPVGRPLLLKALQPNGRIDPKTIAQLQAVMSGGVQQAQEGGR